MSSRTSAAARPSTSSAAWPPSPTPSPWAITPPRRADPDRAGAPPRIGSIGAGVIAQGDGVGDGGHAALEIGARRRRRRGEERLVRDDVVTLSHQAQHAGSGADRVLLAAAGAEAPGRHAHAQGVDGLHDAVVGGGDHAVVRRGR